jgi:hypothetical protein
MRNRDVNVKSILIIPIMGSLGAMCLGVACSPGGSPDTGSTEAAVKAASGACASARDACEAQVQSIAAGIDAACKPVEPACGDDHRGAGGSGGSGGSPADCAAARDACKAAVVSAKPQLEAASASCEASIRTACVVDFGDGGRPGARRDDDGGVSGDHDGGRGGFDHGGDHDGAAGPGRGLESAACEAAETACGQSLASLRSMPPAACTSAETACAGQAPATATAACKTAIGACKDAITTAVSGAHDLCGATIAAACGGHGG